MNLNLEEHTLSRLQEGKKVLLSELRHMQLYYLVKQHEEYNFIKRLHKTKCLLKYDQQKSETHLHT